MRRVLIAYALSGFVSLAYQVAWFRIFSDRFGSTNFTFALVLTCFIGGLAFGSATSRALTRWAARWRPAARGLRLYGAVELAVAASVLLTFATRGLPGDLFGAFPYALQGDVWVPSLGLRVAQVLVADLCVLLPCFFMGVTFPLLCDVFRGHEKGARFPAALYAWNTLGACSGILACEFLFLPTVGHGTTLAAMAGANALLGGWFLLAPPSWLGDPGPPPPALPSAASPAGSGLRATPTVLVLLAGVSGLVSGALEADLFKRITFVIEVAPGASMAFVSFWAVLAIFLASATVRRAPWLPLTVFRVAFAAAALYCALTWAGVDAIRDAVETWVFGTGIPVASDFEGTRNLSFPSSLAQLWVFVGILVFPPYLAVSLLLPAVCNEIQRRGGHLGVAYALNTLSFCVGLLAFLLVVPRLGNVFFAFKLFGVGFGLVAAWLFLLRPDRPVGVWRPVGLAAALAGAWILVPRDFDPDFFRPESPPARSPARAVRSDGSTTTFVVDLGGHPQLYFGRLQMSATHLRARTYMRLMAHVPLLLHPEPRRALLICLGVGNTGSAIAQHPSIEVIDVVDRNHQVIHTLPEFEAVHGGLQRDPRVRFVHDDGRSFLARSHERYDLVTSEPPPPLAAGVYRLYSTDYYSDVARHLTPRGLMSQWLPLFGMSPEAVELAVASFVEVFPHAFVFTGFGTDFVLVGSPSPIDLSLVVSRLAESPEVAADLAAMHVRDAADLLARITQDDRSLRRNYAGGRRIADERNDLDRQLLDPRRRPVIRLELASVRETLRAALAGDEPETASRVEALLGHLGRLQYHVQGYPIESLATVTPADAPDVALAGVDWLSLAPLHQANHAAIRRGRPADAIRALEGFLAVADEQPAVLLQLARLERQRGGWAAARSHLEHFLSLEPDDSFGHELMARTLEQTGDQGAALRHYEQAARLAPGDASVQLARAWLLATGPEPGVRDPGRALEAVRLAALRAGETDSRLLEVEAAARAAAGEPTAAEALARRALAMLPAESLADRQRLREQLARYRAGLALSGPGSATD